MQKDDSSVINNIMEDLAHVDDDPVEESNIIDADVKEIISDKVNTEDSQEVVTEETPIEEYEEPDNRSNIIKTATPFIINTTKSNNNNKEVATLTFLCVLGDESIITINRTFVIEDDIDKDIIESIDFHANSEFINNRICYNIIAKYLPSYHCNFKFNVDNLDNDGKIHNEVYIDCTNIFNRSEVKRFYMNSEIYCAMKFIDDYIFNTMIENEHDLQLATIVGSKENNDVEFFVVDSIENIVNMVSTKKKPKGIEAIKSIFDREADTNIGLVFRASRTTPEKKEIVSILTPFDIGVELDKSKFKGDTVEDLENNYFGDSDQYVATLIINDTHIEVVDKSYMVIRGKTKNGTTKIFLLDNAIKNDLIKKIKDY